MPYEAKPDSAANGRGDAMIRIAVCDDEAAVREQIAVFLERYALEKDLDISVMQYQDGEKIVDDMRAGTSFHLIYMDIEMEKMDGLRAAEQIREMDATVPLIFVTSHETYAIRGYDVRALTYLLKPINEEKIIKSFEQARRELQKHEMYFVFEKQRSRVKLPVREILYFQSSNKKVEVYMTDRKEEFTAKLDDVEFELVKREFEFLRIHKSYLVNFKYITRINGDRIILTNGETLQISERYCTKVKAQYLRLVEMGRYN